MFGIRFQITRIWQRHFIDQVTVLSVMISMFTAMILCGGLIVSSQKKINSWTRSSEGSLVLPGSLDGQQKVKLEEILNSTKLVDSFKFQSKKEYFNEFSKRYVKDNNKLKIGAGLNLFPSRYILQLSEAPSLGYKEKIKTIESKVTEAISSPAQFIYGEQWAEKTKDFSQKMGWIGFLVIGLFAILASYICSVFSQNFISSFLDEIRIKVMIGAKAKHTVGPIFINTICLITFSFFVAVLFSYGLIELVTKKVANQGIAFFQALSLQEYFTLCLTLSFVVAIFSVAGLFFSWLKMKTKLEFQ